MRPVTNNSNCTATETGEINRRQPNEMKGSKMKTKLIIALSATTLSCLTSPMWADQLYENANSRDQDETQSHRMHKLGDLKKANHIIGMEVKNDQGEKLGKVKDLALDMQNGRIVAVIMASGGVLGMDQKLVAVPPSAFAIDDSLKALRINADKELLKAAPEFKMSQWKEATEDGQVKEVYQYYGVRPYYGPVSWNTNANANDLAAARADARTQDKRGQASRIYTFKGDNAAGQATNDNFYASYDARNRPQSLGLVVRASKVLGSSAYNKQDEKLGKVDNLVVDLPAGRVVEVVLASGGFLGINDELSAVPPQSFQCDAENARLTLDTTKEALKTAPHFKSSDWGYVNDPARVTEVYTIYRVQPYFGTTDQDDNAAAAHNADNTARNVRDRSSDALTPLDQGKSESDRTTTAQIRKSIMANKELSSNAHNVKIITIDGHVTLRGAVNSEEEKRSVAQAAANIASAVKIDNQLEVRTPTPASTDSSK
ncbi:MAG: antigen [Pedosphaera sp.]|nr:antigen [Pedosphaera sp.]